MTSADPRERSATPRPLSVIVVGGGIAGLYCARELAGQGFQVDVFEVKDVFGGRIETAALNAEGIPFKAEFGPMRFELAIEPLFEKLCSQLRGITFEPFSPPRPAPSALAYPLRRDECSGSDPLSSLELLKLGVFRMFGMKCAITSEGVVALDAEAQWRLDNELDDDGSFDDLRRDARLQGYGRHLYELGFWNALETVLSRMAVRKVMEEGTFYHLMPDNPNAVEWGIFWLRLCKSNAGMSTIPEGVSTVVEKLVAELELAPNVHLHPNRLVTALAPTDDTGVRVVTTDPRDPAAEPQSASAADVILALPSNALASLAAAFPEEVRAYLESVIPFPLLKVFVTMRTPPWWDHVPTAQENAWQFPTRELHYFPVEQLGRATMLLLYTDRPASVYWQQYVTRQYHDRAEVNASPNLKADLWQHLFELHWSWADSMLRKRSPSDRRRHVTDPRLRILAELMVEFALLDEPTAQSGVRRWRQWITLEPEKFAAWLWSTLGDYAIRDWSRPPFGAGCHAWRPGAKSWEARPRLASFGLAAVPNARNVHICGEAYSDYQGFIEGALRSARTAIEEITAAAPGPSGL